MLKKRLSIVLIILSLIATACGNSGPTPFPTVGVTVQAFPHVEIIVPTETPVTPSPTTPPSETPLPSNTPAPTDTAVPTLTATALIQLAPPTATTVFVQPTQFRPTKTPVPSPTVPPPAGPLTLRVPPVSFVGAQLDPSRPPDGSLTTLSLEFSGSRPPYSVTHDGELVVSNSNGDGQFENSGVKYTYIHFTIPKTCGGHVFGTIYLQGGDGQSITNGYWIDDAPCS